MARSIAVHGLCSLLGETFVPAGEAFEICVSRAHGHVQAVALAMQRLGLAAVLASKPCRERELVLAMVASRIVAPATKLATTGLWHTTTLGEDFGVLRPLMIICMPLWTGCSPGKTGLKRNWRRVTPRVSG